METIYYRDASDDSPWAHVRRQVFLMMATSGVVTLLDGLWHDMSLWMIGLAVGLCMGATLLTSLLGPIVFALVRCLPVKTRLLGVGVIGMGGGVFCASGMNAFIRMSGPHPAVGWLSLVGSTVLVVAASLIAWGLLPPDPETPEDRTQSQWAPRFWVPLGLLGVVVLYGERHLWVGQEPFAHLAAWLFGVWALSSAIATPLGSNQLPIWLTRPVYLCALAMSLTAVQTLHRHTEEELSTLETVPSVERALYLLRGISDVDGDGYSNLLGGGDCAPFESEIHPDAVEVPNNGQDDNCDPADDK